MTFTKSLLLGTAAGIVAVAGANAADMPNKKSAPVEYVRVCSEHGKGFFYIPGSDACIQISGRVRADTQINETYQRNADKIGFGSQFRIALDVRQNTPYGVVRAFLRTYIGYSVSSFNLGSYANSTGGPGNASVGNGSGLHVAYVQFAGLTAGLNQSFFDLYADGYNWAAIRSSDVGAPALAYTATLGNGWSLTAALEDGNIRRMLGQNFLFTGYSAARWDGARSGLISSYGIMPAGQSVPDAIGVLRVDQKWGTAQLSGALHQVRPAFASAATGGNYLAKDATYGWAVKGGVGINLPMIAPGDQLWLEAAYAHGALGYIGALNYPTMPTLNIPVTDAVVGNNGDIKLTNGFSLSGDFLHNWTPNWRSNVFASYMKIEGNRAGYGTNGVFVNQNATTTNYNYGFVPFSEYRVGTNLIWAPVKNFDIGVEVLYTRVNAKGRVLSYNNGTPLKTISSEDNFQGRLRLQRDF